MKPELLTLSFILFGFTVAFSDAATAPPLFPPGSVLDKNGEPVSAVRKYYVMPRFVPDYVGPVGGGVKIDKTGNSTCPESVLQDYADGAKGLPVKFTASSGMDPILAGKPLNISFDERPGCAESSTWVDVRSDDFDGHWVGIGGAVPIKLLIDGSFQIQKYDNSSYKFVFCIELLPPATNNCFDVGRLDDSNITVGRRLVLNFASRTGYIPYPVEFVPAE